MASILYRVDSIKIGKNSTTYFEWKGIKDFRYEETSTWVHIDVPGGLMVHQEILSPHVRGEIRVVDLTDLNTALYNTVIDDYNHKAIGSSPYKQKYKAGYFVVNARNQYNVLVTLTVGNFRVEFITLESLEVNKDTIFVVHFTADYINT